LVFGGEATPRFVLETELLCVLGDGAKAGNRKFALAATSAALAQPCASTSVNGLELSLGSDAHEAEDAGVADRYDEVERTHSPIDRHGLTIVVA
jgi:hypothetical protein